MIQISRNPAISTDQLWLLNLIASHTEPKLTGRSSLWAELKTRLIALAITTLDEPSYRLNESWTVA